MGVDLIHDELEPFGFGRRTGIDVAGEVTGTCPPPSGSAKFKRPEQQKWYAGETISLGIGQGYNNFTMLQMATAMSTLATGGQRFKPRLVRDVEDVVRHENRRIASDALPPPPLKPEHVQVILSAMNGVTLEGTSRLAFQGAPTRVAAKRARHKPWA